nr:SseB family protein [uncultured Butyrivibrio sp.]
MNLLTLNEYYLLLSKITGKPYIDERRNCYLFANKSDAESFCEEIKDTEISEASHYRMQFITDMHRLGVTNIRVMPRSNSIEDIPIEESDLKKGYVNIEANFNAIMIKQTRKKKYMKALKRAVFLTPILIDPRLPGRYPEMHYSYATTNGEDMYYCLFTTLSEFDEWNKEQPQDWKAVEMPLYKICRIKKKSPVIINPLSDKLILTNAQVSEILRG